MSASAERYADGKDLKPLGVLWPAGRLRAAAFDTGLRMPLSGSAAGKLEDALRKRGCTLAAPAQRFHVTGIRGPLADGELGPARDWARSIVAQ